MAKTPEDDWFDYDRAAAYLHKKIPGGFTRRAVENAKRRGDIRSTRIRGKIWFHKVDLDQYVIAILITRKEARAS